MRSTSPEMTQEVGQRFAKALKPRDVVALEGELGSGKTCFVQGVARGLGVPPKTFVRSPSFTILNQYQGDITLYHLDFYRLDEHDDLDDLGLDELFDGDGITVVEWADKFRGALPPRTIRVHFAIVDGDTRDIDMPSRYEKTVAGGTARRPRSAKGRRTP